MPTDVLLPQWGMGMTEAVVVEWLKAEGDLVEEGEPLVEVESEKVTDTVAAPTSGVLWSITAGLGETVEVGVRLAVILALEEADAQRAVPDGDGQSGRTDGISDAASLDGDDPDADRATLVASAVPPVPPPPQAEPRARRLLREHGLELGDVRGTGPGNRVLLSDVERHLEEGSRSTSTTVPLDGTRAVIARRMMASLRETAQLTISTHADVTDLTEYQERGEAPLPAGYTACIVRAVAMALIDHPRLNATVEGETITHHDEIRVGVAVALDEGLVVPSVCDPDRKSVHEIERDIKALTDRASRHLLSRADLRSTFTVSNLGPYGVDLFTPIINPPEVAILGVGRVVERPRRAGSEIAWRQVMGLSLTFDHRVLDGVPAALFLQDVANHLGDVQELVTAPDRDRTGQDEEAAS